MWVFQRFIFQFANIAQLLYALIVIFEWTKECEFSFQKLREGLINAPILQAPNWNKIFHVHVDVSKFAIGCVLAQLRECKMEFLVFYASRQLNNANKNYTTIE